MKKSVYIAGPMRGIPNHNYDAFDSATVLGRALGWHVHSAANLSRAIGFEGSAFDPNGTVDFTPAQLRVFALQDVTIILSLRAENGDAIALLPGWENSIGARAEKALAEWVKLPILDALTFELLEQEKCNFIPPTPGFGPCTRSKGHSGPCAHIYIGI